jgi:DNA-binding NarL/FixJ family response regulator
MESNQEHATSTSAQQEGRAKILLVDDHEVVRFGIGQFLNRQPDLVVCGQAETSAAAMEAIDRLAPDLVTVDLTLGNDDGLELIKNIRAQHPALPLLVISMHDESLYAELALHAGASGYVMKQQSLETLLQAVRKVLSGTIYVSEALTNRILLKRTRQSADAALPPMKRLSDRELQVFQLIGQWKGTRQIATELHLSVKTVEYYREQIKKKLNLRNGTELLQMARQWVEGKLAA